MPKWYTKKPWKSGLQLIDLSPKKRGVFPKLPSESQISRWFPAHQTLNPLLPIVLALNILFAHCCCLLFFLLTQFYFRFFFSQRFCGRTFITPTRQKLLEIQFERNLKVPAAANPRSTGKPKVTSAVSGGFPRTPPTVYPWNLIGCTWRGGTKKCKK